MVSLNVTVGVTSRRRGRGRDDGGFSTPSTRRFLLPTTASPPPVLWAWRAVRAQIWGAGSAQCVSRKDIQAAPGLLLGDGRVSPAETLCVLRAGSARDSVCWRKGRESFVSRILGMDSLLWGGLLRSA